MSGKRRNPSAGFDTSRSYTVKELLELLGPESEVTLASVDRMPGRTDKTEGVSPRKPYSRSEVCDVLGVGDMVLRTIIGAGHLKYDDETEYITGQSLARFYTEFRGGGYVLLKEASSRIASGMGLGVNTVEQNFKRMFGESEYARNFGTERKTLWAVKESEIDLLVDWAKNRGTGKKPKPRKPRRKRPRTPANDRKAVAAYGREVLKRYGIDHRMTSRLVEGGFLGPGESGELTRQSYDDFDGMMKREKYVAFRTVSYQIAGGLGVSENTLIAFGVPRLVGLVNLGTRKNPLYVVRRTDVNSLIERSKPNFGRKSRKAAKPPAPSSRKRTPRARNSGRKTPSAQENKPVSREPFEDVDFSQPGGKMAMEEAEELPVDSPPRRRKRTRKPAADDTKSSGLGRAYGDPLKGKYDKFRHLISGD